MIFGLVVVDDDYGIWSQGFFGQIVVQQGVGCVVFDYLDFFFVFVCGVFDVNLGVWVDLFYFDYGFFEEQWMVGIEFGVEGVMSDYWD